MPYYKTFWSAFLTLVLIVAGATFLFLNTSTKKTTSETPNTATSSSTKPKNQNNNQNQSKPTQNETEPTSDLEITLDKTIVMFNSGQTISGKLINGSKINYYSSSGRFGCTIYSLEMKDAGNWKDVSSCVSMSPVGIITIAPGEIPFNIGSLEVSCPKAPCSELSKGSYRLSLSYSETRNSASAKTIYSPEFEIR